METKNLYLHRRQSIFEMWICFFAWLICLPVANGQGTLVQNGDFTSPDGLTIPGWNVSGGLVWSAFNGVNGGSYAGIGGSFSQSLPTQPGQTYLLQFHTTTGVPGVSQGGPYGLSVTWDSETPISYTSTRESYNWMPVERQFIAQGPQTLLTFSRIYGAIPYLDAVSVSTIPEPSSVSLSIVAIILLSIWRLSSASSQKPNEK